MKQIDVTIYKFVNEIDDECNEFSDCEAPYADLRVELACLAVVTVDVAPDDTDERVCARAWVECVGLAHLEILTKIGAPEVLVRHVVDVDQIADELVRPPSGLPVFGFLFDNMVDTWLLSPAWEESERDATRLVRSRLGGHPAFPLSLVRGPTDLVRSLRYPKPN